MAGDVQSGLQDPETIELTYSAVTDVATAPMGIVVPQQGKLVGLCPSSDEDAVLYVGIGNLKPQTLLTPGKIIEAEKVFPGIRIARPTALVSDANKKFVLDFFYDRNQVRYAPKGTVRIKPAMGPTPNVGNNSPGAGFAQFIGANANRKALIIQNRSAVEVYIRPGGGAQTTAQTFSVLPQSYISIEQTGAFEAAGAGGDIRWFEELLS